MKRLLLFLALLGIGIAALLVAIGDEDAVKAGPRPTDPEPTRPPPTGIEVNQGRVGATVAQTGYLKIPTTARRCPTDARGRREPSWRRRTASRSKQGGGGWKGRRVQLFEQQTAATCSRQAFVELGRDANGQAELQRDRTWTCATRCSRRSMAIRCRVCDSTSATRVKVGDNELRIGTAATSRCSSWSEGARQRKSQPMAASTGARAAARCAAGTAGDHAARAASGRHDAVRRHQILRARARTHGAVVHASAACTASRRAQRHGTTALADGVQLDLQRGVSMSGWASLAQRGRRQRCVVHHPRRQLHRWLLRGGRSSRPRAQRTDLAAPPQPARPRRRRRGGRLATPRSRSSRACSGRRSS